MKRLSVGLVLMLLCTLSIFAQNKVISVSGRVVESDSKEPAAQATVQLLSLPDSAYAAGIASSNKGWFTLPKVKAGKYLLKISYIVSVQSLFLYNCQTMFLRKKWGILLWNLML